MVQKIRIGGEERSVAYSVRMQFCYEMEFRENCLAAAADMARAGVVTANPELLEDDSFRRVLPIVTLTKLMWAALKAGAEAQREGFDASVYDVAGWIDDLGASDVEKMVANIMNMMPREHPDMKTPAAEKKRTAKPVTKARR